MRTLIVDDSRTTRNLIERALAQAGLHPTETFFAADGHQALNILRTLGSGYQLDLILADLNMPVMNGIEFLERLRAERLSPNVPIAILAAEHSEPLLRRSVSLGALAYITKPFTTSCLRRTLFPLLNRQFAQ